MEFKKRKQIRLKGYDYSQNGLYFVTVCTKNHSQILWKPQIDVGATLGRPLSEYRMSNGYKNIKSILTDYGIIIDNEINNISKCYNYGVNVDEYVIMPNHIHLIIKINKIVFDINGRPQVAPTNKVPTVSRIMQQFKGAVTKQIGISIWQKSFYDHIIRNRKEYEIIVKYIQENPMKWEEDCLYTSNKE